MESMEPAASVDLLSRLKNSVNVLVRERGTVRVNGKVASDRTVQITIDVILAACERLWRMGYQFGDIRKLDERHVRALIRDWYASGHDPKTIQNGVSRLRQICRWIGKPRIIPARDGAMHFLPEVEPKYFHVNPVATRSKSWSENGINVIDKIRQADAIDRRFGAMLRLGLAFGLRKKEQLRIAPDKADAVTHLLIRDNIGKSGKDREIPIMDPFQRTMLEHAKRVAGRGRHLGWPGRTFKQNEDKYSYHMKKIGITGRDADCVGHGLRAEFSENMSMQLGLVPATLGGTEQQMDKAQREAIQMKVSEAMGHHRINVTRAYYGDFRARPVLQRKGESYIEFQGFKALVITDMQSDKLRGVLASENGEDIEFSSDTPAGLRAEFKSIVEQILRGSAEKNVEVQIGGGPEQSNLRQESPTSTI